MKKLLSYLFLFSVCFASATAVCIDYDRGINPYQYGMVFAPSLENNAFYEDFFDSCSDGIVTEFYCKNDSIAWTNYACARGCRNIFIYNLSSSVDLGGLADWGNLEHNIGYCNPTSNPNTFEFAGVASIEVSPPVIPPPEPECTRNSDCGHNQKCVKGVCEKKDKCHKK